MKLATKFGTQQIIILALALTTAAIHLYLFLSYKSPIMLLNSLGYVGLLGLYLFEFSFLPIQRSWVRWVMMAYAALTIVMYFVTQISTGGNPINPVGIFTKLVEVALIYFLWRDR